MAGLAAEIIHGSNDLQPAEHAKNAVILPTSGLSVEMASNVDRQRVRVGSWTGCKHGTQLVDAHGETGFVAPRLEQRAPFGILVGKGLAVIATRHARADPGHVHEALPEPFTVDLEISARRGHGISFEFFGIMTLLIPRGNALRPVPSCRSCWRESARVQAEKSGRLIA